jgi:acyl-CoA thioesterase-1
MRLARLLLLAVALGLLAAAGARAQTCAVPPELEDLGAPLPRTAQRLLHDEPLTIVAIGSSSTAGYGVALAARAYPNRLAVELEQRLPGETLHVFNKGVSGEEAPDMLRRFDRDVLALKPDLVIWQVGTNAAVRDLDPAAIDATVRAGLGRLKAAGADVILMDMQFSPRVTRHAGFAAITANLASAARDEHVGRFRRFDMMRHWVETRQLDFKRLLQPDQLHPSDFSQACIAHELAVAILERARPATAQAGGIR